MHNLALVYTRQYRSAEAEALYRAAIELQRSVLGEDHPDVFLTMNALASVLSDQGKVDEAEALFRQVLEGQIQGQQLELDRHAHLLARDARALEEVPPLTLELEAARTLLAKLKEDADQADAQWRSSRAIRDALTDCDN